ncbi:MAG: hypothetical protein KBS81_00890 [Spirochaetales bacterium]|nr:hypothetical protein [Candidatus Physcosoma equi]
MKKFVALLFFLVLWSSCSAFAFSFGDMVSSCPYSREFSIGLDFMSLDSLLMEDSRFDVELAIPVDECRLIFPIRYGKDGEGYIKYLETGLLVALNPIDGLDFFVEASFLKVGWLWGLYQTGDPLVLSTEGSLGWYFSWGNLFLKPKVTVRNPYLTESDKVELMKRISQFGDLRFSLVGGYVF